MYPEKKPELYGGDAFLLGQSPGEEQFKQAMGTLAPPQLQPGVKSQQGAEGQLWQGIQQQQQLGQAMASRRGYNPLAARAATASGAEMESQGFGAAQGIRAGEEAQRRAQQLQAYQARSAYDQAMAQLGQKQFQGSLDRQLYEDAMQRAFDEQKRQKRMAEEEGWMNALQGVGSLVGEAVQGLIGSDPKMKQNVQNAGSSTDAILQTLQNQQQQLEALKQQGQQMPSVPKVYDDVDKAMALINPTGKAPDAGWIGKIGKAFSGNQPQGLVKNLFGGKAAAVPGGIPIQDQELFNWSAQQAGQSLGGAAGGLNLGSLGGLLGGILSDPSTKQNIADGSEAVDNALYTREPFEGDAVARIRSLYGERGEQPVGNAILEETGDYGSATSPRTATMYLGDLPTGARIVQAPGVQNEIAAISKQLDEMTPFEQMIALNRGKAVPASERLASAGEAIGAASVAADPRFQQLNQPMATVAAPKPVVVAVAKPSAAPRAKAVAPVTFLPTVTMANDQGRVFNTDEYATEINANPFVGGQSFTQQLLDYQKKKKQNALASQLAQKAEASRNEAVNAMSTDDIIKAYGDELLNSAEQSIMQTGGVDVQGVLGTPLPKDIGKKVDDTMDNVVPKRFEYKDGAKQDASERGISTPEGTNVGVMTSDLRKSQLGRSIVNPTDMGDTIDPAKAVSLSLAAAARNNQRLRENERTLEQLKAKMNKRNA